jgi:hypothetical protein
MLTLKDGRKAAFEVTNLAGDGALEIARLLAKDRHRWSAPGQRFWSIEVAASSDRRRLEKCYEKIILMCEAAGIAYPDRLSWWAESADPDLRWLVEDSQSIMTGYPGIPAKGLQQHPGVMVVSVSGGGVVDSSLSGFADELSTAFQAPHISSHFDKLAAADADERHLFIPLHPSALPFSSFSVLQFEDALPPEPPRIPDHVTHLWLAPESSQRVLIWSRADGWRNFYPNND